MLQAQETVYPAKAQKGRLLIKNGTVHIGNGQVIDQGSILIQNGKIIGIGKEINSTEAIDQTVDAAGKHVYPGLILSQSQLGLIEVPTVRASSDASEIGEMNSNIRSIVAYNTDSKVINTLRTNGILLAQVSPEGSLITGSSSVVQLDAWNWEDAAYATDNGIHFQMPSMLARRMGRGFMFAPAPAGDPVKMALEQVDKVKEFLREAKAYNASTQHEQTNLKFAAVKGLFEHKQKLYVHCDIVKEMLVAIDFVKEFGIDVVIVGGSDSWMIADLLKQYNVSVILGQMHNLPAMVDDDIDQPFKTPAILQKAGVLYAINDDDGNTRSRNLAFNAGTAATYGLTKEEALTAITLNPAKILGIADKAGSLEIGKDANIVISKGDILDMKTSVITQAFIQGRTIELTDKHKQLAERYHYKYGLK
jgi:imidazolonepropionase-like amidohydrolase